MIGASNQKRALLNRSYPLEIIAKREGMVDSFYVTLMPPRDELDPRRPFWLIRQQETGAPLELQVTAEEFAGIEVGDVLTAAIWLAP